MSVEESKRDKYITIAECEICSKLAEVETTFYKYGSEDLTRSFPPEVARLEQFQKASTYDGERHHARRCPICGIFYQYDASYEYLVNGSEDEEELIRLTPAQAKCFMNEETYAFLMERMVEGLTDANPSTQRYAAKCLVSHHLERDEMSLVSKYVTHSDPQVARGALSFLRQLVSSGSKLPKISELVTVFETLANSSDLEIAQTAKIILAWIKP